MTWVDAMLNDGVRAWITSDHFAARTGDAGTHGPVRLVVWRRYARPADLQRLPAGDAFVVLGRATQTVLHRLDDAGRAWATLDGQYSLPQLGRRSDIPAVPDPIACRQPPAAQDELALLLDACPGATHAEYAAALGVTRARVTQMLNRRRADDPWPGGRAGTAGHVTRWWSAAEPWQQAKSAYRWLEHNGCDPVLGGETAADAIAPWRAPGSSILHVRKIVPPSNVFVPADSPGSATVTVVVDYRPSVRIAAARVRTPVGELLVAHPLHIADDLADEAAVDERLREQTAVLRRHGRSARTGPESLGNV